MKRYLLIAILALTFSFTGIVAAEQGSGDGTASSSATSVHQDNGDENEPEDGISDDRGGEQERMKLPPPGAPIGAPVDNRGEKGGGLLQLFKKDREENKQQRQDFLNTVQEDRSAIQEKRKTEVGNLKESRAALEAVIKEKRDALKADIDKIKKEKASVRKTFVETHFTDALTNLHTLADRIGSKIDELSGKGYDLSGAKQELAAATDSLDKAAEQLAALKAVTVSDTNDSTVTKPRELAKQVEASLKDARDHFSNAIKVIKAAVGIPDDTADGQGQQTSQQ